MSFYKAEAFFFSFFLRIKRAAPNAFFGVQFSQLKIVPVVYFQTNQ